jgi:hypothetical protein
MTFRLKVTEVVFRHYCLPTLAKSRGGIQIIAIVVPSAL